MGTGAWLFIIGVVILLVIEIYKLGKRYLHDLTLVPGVTDAVVGFCEARQEDVCLVECKDCLQDIIKPGRSCQHLNQNITMDEFDRRKLLLLQAKNEEGELEGKEKEAFKLHSKYNERGEY